jgi:hypothetical protein
MLTLELPPPSTLVPSVRKSMPPQLHYILLKRRRSPHHSLLNRP